MRHRSDPEGGDVRNGKRNVTSIEGGSGAPANRLGRTTRGGTDYPLRRRPALQDFLARATQTEIALLYPAGISEAALLHSTSGQALAKGVKIRAVCDARVLARSTTRKIVKEQLGLGVRVRITQRPVSHFLALVEPSAVLVSQDPTLAGDQVAITYNSTFVLAMRQLFEHMWVTSVPWQDVTCLSADPLSRPPYDEVIRLLSEGLSDEAAAQDLQISIRTFRRHVAHIKEHLHARNRFQAGVRLVRRTDVRL